MRDKFEKAAFNGRAEAFVALIAERGICVEDPAATPGATDDPDDDYLVVLARGIRASCPCGHPAHSSIASTDFALWSLPPPFAVHVIHR